jgi:hypothetical protein
MALQEKQGHASDVQRAVNPGFEFHVSLTSDRQVYPKIHGHQLFREVLYTQVSTARMVQSYNAAHPHAKSA